jgi:subfamily B ATP-binding cassette protein MsbA
MKIRRVSSIFAPLTQLIVATALACIVFILLSPATLAEYTTAELIGYLTAIALLPKPFRQLSGVNAIIQRGLVGAEIVFGLMDTPAEKDEGEYESETIQGNIEVKNLNFKYPNTDKQTLKNISFSIKQGEMIALVGESGGGKSTLASLFNRSYQCADGSILIDGVDINEYKLDNLRKHVSVVDQNIFLFNNSIRSNIAYGDTEYTDEEITEAMKLSHSYDFIQGQEKGIDTIIGDNGLMLSGGQRQRLSIARAFLKKSPILILDEATSSLDNESERIIKQAIQELAKERTTIIIAHRLSTIEQADRLLVLHQGEIIETGSHKELLQKGGYYSNLFNAEFAQLSGR